VILEFDEEENDNVNDEWKNVTLRESIAKNSLVRVRKIHSGTFLTKGKMNEIGYYIKEKENIDVIYINS
jgi:predicted RNA-binding protein YlxR (DUF448 family)